MRRYLLIGTCAAILGGGGVALAQMPPASPGGEGPHGPSDGDGQMGMMEHHWHHHHFMARGTTYRFRRGDDEIVVSCSVGEPVQNCVNGASALLDKLNVAGATAPKPGP